MLLSGDIPLHLRHPVEFGAHFVVATPCFVLELVTVMIPLAIEVAELAALVNAARDPSRLQDFPVLVAAYPQPARSWGTWVAVPAWSQHVITVLIDTSAIDGRFFAVGATAVADRYVLLQLAFLPVSAAFLLPLRDGEEIRLHSGDSIVFLPVDFEVPAPLYLEDMLRSPWLWRDVRPAFGDQDACDLLVSDGAYYPFFPQPDRALFYRRDVASIVGYPEASLRLQPAAPRVRTCARLRRPGGVSFWTSPCRLQVGCGFGRDRSSLLGTCPCSQLLML